MRKRVWFYRVYPAIAAFGVVSRCLPRPACRVLLECVRYVPGLVGIGLRYIMVARLAKRCGKNVAVFEGVYLRNIETMEIGDNVSIHEMCYIEAKGGLKIGSDVSIAHGSSLLTTEHGYECGGITRDAAVVERAVEIMNDVWIGCGVRVLAGCTVGEGAVVGAGAVVTRDIPDRTIAVGIPAKPLRSR